VKFFDKRLQIYKNHVFSFPEQMEVLYTLFGMEDPPEPGKCQGKYNNSVIIHGVPSAPDG